MNVRGVYKCKTKSEQTRGTSSEIVSMAKDPATVGSKETGKLNENEHSKLELSRDGARGKEELNLDKNPHGDHEKPHDPNIAD